MTPAAPGRIPVRHLWATTRDAVRALLHIESTQERVCATVALVATPPLVPIMFELTVRHPALALLPATPLLIGSVWYLLAMWRGVALRPLMAWGTMGLMVGAVLVMLLDVVLGTRGMGPAIRGAAELLVSAILTGLVASATALALRWGFGGR